jgi:hypothetical protein
LISAEEASKHFRRAERRRALHSLMSTLTFEHITIRQGVTLYIPTVADIISIAFTVTK